MFIKMITWIDIKSIFPREISIHISEYDHQHRINNSKLLDELLDQTQLLYCGNIYCDEELEKYWMINRKIYGKEYYLCCNNCVGECEDNRREYLKAMYYRKQMKHKI